MKEYGGWWSLSLRVFLTSPTIKFPTFDVLPMQHARVPLPNLTNFVRSSPHHWKKKKRHFLLQVKCFRQISRTSSCMSLFCSPARMWPCKCRSKIREFVLVVSLPYCCAVVTLLQSKQRLGHFIIDLYQLSKTALIHSDCIGGKVKSLCVTVMS